VLAQPGGQPGIDRSELSTDHRRCSQRGHNVRYRHPLGACRRLLGGSRWALARSNRTGRVLRPPP
jgi:hypothetical protein